MLCVSAVSTNRTQSDIPEYAQIFVTQFVIDWIIKLLGFRLIPGKYLYKIYTSP